MEHWKLSGTAGGQIFAHLNDHFRKRTFFCFYWFWRHAVITLLYRLSGRLTSPLVGISMCEQAQNGRNEVHVNTVPEGLLWIFSGNWLWIRTIDFETQWGSGSQSPTEDPFKTVCLYHNHCKKERRKTCSFDLKGPKSFIGCSGEDGEAESQPMVGLNIFDWIIL